MYDDNGQLKYGNASASDQTSHWIIEEEGEVQRIRNRATGRYISISGVTSDKVAVKVVDAEESRDTEQWVIENLKTEGPKLIRNKAHSDRFLHVEKKLGFVQYGVIPREWGSPKWTFVPVSDQNEKKYVRFKNRYTGKVLFEDDGKVKYGDPALEDPLSHWIVEDAGGNAKRIRNRATGHYMNVEGMQSGENSHLLPLKSTAIEESWTSAKWMFTERSDGYTVIENVYQPGHLIHVEDNTGFAQSSPIPADWWSAHWILEEAPALLPVEVPDGFVRLKNAETGAYLYENKYGIVLYGAVEEGDARSHWQFAEQEEQGGLFQIVNRATGHVISAEAGEAFLESKDVVASSKTDQWYVEPAPVEGRILLRSAARPLEYVHLQDRMGFAQLGLRSIESPAVQWIIESAPADSFVPEPTSSSEAFKIGRWDDTRLVRIENVACGMSITDDGTGPGAVKKGGKQPNAVWMLQDENGYKLLRNQGTGRYLGVAGDQLTMASLVDGLSAPRAMQWRLIERSGKVLLESVAAPGMFLHNTGNILGLSAGSENSPAAEQLFRLVPLQRDVVFEGEEAFLAGGASAGMDAKGFEGAGYAGGFTEEGATAIFSVYAEKEGKYDAIIRYANGSGSAQRLTLSENGLHARKLHFPATSSWDKWMELKTTLKLRRGINSVAFTLEKGDKGNVLLDNVTVIDIVPRKYRGVSVSYDLYEAEHAETNGTVIGPDRTYRQLASEASGRQAVRLEKTGDFVEFTLDRPANRLTVRYAIPDSTDGSGAVSPVGLYINNAKLDEVVFTSKYAWVYGSYPWSNNPDDGDAHRFYDETSIAPGNLAAGTKVRIEKEADSTASYIVVDLIEADWADDPYPMPKGFLSIADFGAVADDEVDDTEAIRAAIAAARKQGKGVWIPKGVFRVDNGPIEVADVTIRGAGKWHSILAGGGFMGTGNRIRIYDLAIDGEVNARRDELPESGFDGTFGKGSTIQHVRIDHTKTGIWVTTKNVDGGNALSTEGLYIMGVQIRNTFADGINFSTGTKNSMAEQNQIRNTGDDGMAMWANGVQSIGNTFRYNTVELPWLSNNIAVYGGKNVKLTDNVVSDTVAFGAGISISTRHNPVPFEGTVLVERNTFIRTGGREHNWPADFGGLFLFAGDKDMTGDIQIRDNLIYDSTYQGISLLGEKLMSGIVLENNVVDGTGSWGVNASGNIKGSALFGNTIVRGVRVGELMDGVAGFEFLTKDGGFSFVNPPFKVVLGEQKTAPFKIEAGEELHAKVIAGDDGGFADGVNWSVADTTIAEVRSDGTVIGKRKGTTLLTVQYAGEKWSYTLIVTDSAAPVWPEGAALSVMDNCPGSVTVSWPAAQDNSGVTVYRITWGNEFRTVKGSETQLQLTGLRRGALYTIQVDARDESGNWTAEPLKIQIRPSGRDSGSRVIVPVPLVRRAIEI